MSGLITFITKQGWKILLALLVCAVLAYVAHSYTSSVKQNATLTASNETLTSTVKQTEEATQAVTGKLTKLDAISQEKTKSEAALREDNANFHRGIRAAAQASTAVKQWADEPVPGPVLDSLRFATEAAGGSDEGSGGDHPEVTDRPH